jgi:hypothetical protein
VIEENNEDNRLIGHNNGEDEEFVQEDEDNQPYKSDD